MVFGNHFWGCGWNFEFRLGSLFNNRDYSGCDWLDPLICLPARVEEGGDVAKGDLVSLRDHDHVHIAGEVPRGCTDHLNMDSPGHSFLKSSSPFSSPGLPYHQPKLCQVVGASTGQNIVHDVLVFEGARHDDLKA